MVMHFLHRDYDNRFLTRLFHFLVVGALLIRDKTLFIVTSLPIEPTMCTFIIDSLWG